MKKREYRNISTLSILANLAVVTGIRRNDGSISLSG